MVIRSNGFVGAEFFIETEGKVSPLRRNSRGPSNRTTFQTFKSSFCSPSPGSAALLALLDTRRGTDSEQFMPVEIFFSKFLHSGKKHEGILHLLFFLFFFFFILSIAGILTFVSLVVMMFSYPLHVILTFMSDDSKQT